VEDQSQGRRGLCAVADATAGSALDCDLCAATQSRHGGRASPALIGQRGAEVSVTAGHHRPTGAGQLPGVGPPRPEGLRPTGAASAAAPGADRSAHSPLRPWSWWSSPSRLTHSLFGASRLQLSIPARAKARRWRAGGTPLNPVGKVVARQPGLTPAGRGLSPNSLYQWSYCQLGNLNDATSVPARPALEGLRN